MQKVNGKNFHSCYGPLSNLEEKLNSERLNSEKPSSEKFGKDFYLKINKIYKNQNQEQIKTEIDAFLEILNLAKDSKILNLYCGDGRYSLDFAKRGYNIEGIDKYHNLIQKAKSQAKKENLNVRFKEGNLKKIKYHENTFDAVLILENSLSYEEDKVLEETLKEIFRILKPSGKLLIDVVDGNYIKENYKPRDWEWLDKKYFVCRERSLSQDGKKLISREVLAHAERGVVSDKIFTQTLYTEESLAKLLESCGFSDVKFYHEFFSKLQSQNNGIEKRIIATAIAKKEGKPTIPKTKKLEKKKVVVILGDPRKPDPLKPNNVFDEDDFYTIEQLKNALKELKEYDFEYLDNHDNLVNELLKLKPKIDFVFNLCDEGYNNDPKKEAHIPTILDILSIPYTGAPPSCLINCYDKSLVRGIAKEMKIPVPSAVLIKSKDSVYNLNFSFPAIVKPVFGDSSFGITMKSVANNIEELINAVDELREKFNYEGPILIEEFLTGKDLTVGIIGNPPEDYEVLPITEEDYSCLPPGFPRICGYEAKWLSNSPYWNIKSIPANLPEDVEKFIIDCCLNLFKRFECRDYARFDWRLDSEGNPKLLEVNPNPGWCWDGHLAKMAKIAGISYSEMLGKILKAAEKRINGKS